jgi:hypothetical protein
MNRTTVVPTVSLLADYSNKVGRRGHVWKLVAPTHNDFA